eukprot:6274882-Prymnesium_polylepis.1
MYAATVENAMVAVARKSSGGGAGGSSSGRAEPSSTLSRIGLLRLPFYPRRRGRWEEEAVEEEEERPPLWVHLAAAPQA